MSKHDFCKCPFFTRALKGTICCEGGTKINFGDGKGQGDYYRKFCCDNWKGCSVAKALIDYYERNNYK